MQGVLFVHLIEVSLVQRRFGICPAPLATGPLTLQVPQGRLLALQLRATVAVPSLMIGARCEIPVQPVSRMLSGALALPVNEILVGQAQVHCMLQTSRPFPAPKFVH